MGRYQADSTDSEKSGPKALSREAFGQATAPGEQVVQNAPWYVLVNSTGSYHFCYSTTGSIGSTYHAPSDYSFGIKIPGAAGQPVKLDINPVAWSGSDGSYHTGDISFVYRGGL